MEFIVTIRTRKHHRKRDLEEEVEWRNNVWTIEDERLEENNEDNGRECKDKGKGKEVREES